MQQTMASTLTLPRLKNIFYFERFRVQDISAENKNNYCKEAVEKNCFFDSKNSDNTHDLQRNQIKTKKMSTNH